MKRKVLISSKAKDLLERHIRFIANVSKDAARKEKKKIIDKVRELDEKADIYPFFEAEYIPYNKYHKMVVDKRYIVLYQIKDAEVYVEYIMDTREDYLWLIK